MAMLMTLKNRACHRLQNKRIKNSDLKNQLENVLHAMNMLVSLARHVNLFGTVAKFVSGQIGNSIRLSVRKNS